MTSAPSSVLLVIPDVHMRRSVFEALSGQTYNVTAAESYVRASEALAQAGFDVVIVQVNPKGDSGAWLQTLRDRVGQELILLTDPGAVPASLLRGGPTEVVGLPLDFDELLGAVHRSLDRTALRRLHTQGEDSAGIGQSLGLHQRCLQLVANPDLEWLQERLLSELTSSANAQSAALWLAGERDELLLRAYRGLLDRALLPDHYDTRGALGTSARMGKPFAGTDARGSTALWVPLLAQGELIGLVQLSDPLSGSFSPELEPELMALADFAATAVRTGRRLLTLQRLGLRDRETGAYNLSYFTDYASKEIYKARRYGRSFALLTCSLDHLSRIRLRLGADEARRAARGVIRALSKIVRDSDVVAKARDHEFYLLLPETDALGAGAFLRRAMAAAREDPDVRDVETRMTLGLVGGAATYPRDGEDFDELIHHCQRRMSERRVSLAETLALEHLSFWDQVELLVGNPKSPRLPHSPNAEPSRRGSVSQSLFTELQQELAHDILREPLARGLVYVGTSTVRSDSALAVALDFAPPELGTKSFLLGRRADLTSHPVVTPIFLDGEDRLNRHEFLLWLGEQSAYALLQRPGRGTAWGFHTSDTAVVEGLIAKLQHEYGLQVGS